MEAILLILTVTACISPLLTAAYLWQLKEWRADRLREHLEREGYVRSLFGLVRPTLVFLGGLVILTRITEPFPIILVTLLLLATASAGQILLRKQPQPRWTQKAITIVAIAIVLQALSLLLLPIIALPLLPLLQPLLLAVAWSMLLPLDASLKRNVFEKAKRLREAHPELLVIGVTGSVGKSTTKELLAHVLTEQNPLVTPAHVNTEMGVSQWLIKTLSSMPSPSPDPSPCIVEMGAYRAGEIALLCSIVQPTLGVITYIGTQHIALFGSQENLLTSKAELFDALPQGGHAFINADSPLATELEEHCACPFTRVSTGGNAELEAFDIEENANGISLTVEQTRMTIPLRGTHNVSNVLLAIAVAKHLGMVMPRIAARLATFALPARTFNVREECGVTILDATHNGSQENVKAVIAWAKNQPFDHKILLLSDLIELGDLHDSVLTEIGAQAGTVFDDILTIHSEAITSLEKGSGKKVSLAKHAKAITPGSLLVCVGRMPPSTVQKLLPPTS